LAWLASNLPISKLDGARSSEDRSSKDLAD
jgi:hypothetical protein